MPRLVVDLFASWRGLFGSSHSAIVWNLVPSCLMWYIWRARNDRSLEICERTMLELKASFFNTLYQWTASLNCFHFYTFRVFLFFFLIFFLVLVWYFSCMSLVCLLCTWVLSTLLLNTITNLKKKKRFLDPICFSFTWVIGSICLVSVSVGPGCKWDC